MEYREHEISARTHCTGNRLWELNPDGSLAEAVYEDINDDDTVVWYEVALVDPDTGFTDGGMQFDTIEDAKAGIDKSLKYLETFE